jgi:hypothetical protein
MPGLAPGINRGMVLELIPGSSPGMTGKGEYRLIRLLSDAA